VRNAVPANVAGSSAAAAGQAAAVPQHVTVPMVSKWLVYLRVIDALCVSWLVVTHLLAACCADT
jgi:hypothetical protein